MEVQDIVIAGLCVMVGAFAGWTIGWSTRSKFVIFLFFAGGASAAMLTALHHSA